MNMTQAQKAMMSRYVNAIRNNTKRVYAYEFASFLALGTPLPKEPAKLSPMAAQAVRLALRGIAEGSYLIP
jgi:hypothetical protein